MVNFSLAGTELGYYSTEGLEASKLRAFRTQTAQESTSTGDPLGAASNSNEGNKLGNT